MEHTNLFLFENESALETKYPNGNVDDVEPGVAYARPDQEEEDGTVYYNRMVTNYSITIHSRNKSGATLLEDRTIQTPKVLDGNTVKTNVVAEPVEGYKPRYAVEKVEFTSASTEHTVTYLAATSYTITVNHMFSGQSIACATTVEVEDVYEEDVVNVKIEPLSIPGYTAEAVYIRVSGDTTYDLEYEESTYEAIDLGLPSGTLWLSCNLGASAPEDYGNFYAWGELETKSESQFTEENYRFYNGASDDYTKYNDSDGIRTLELADDVANAVMGGDWHIPSNTQVIELLKNTTSGVTDVNGVSGIRLTSNNNGNSIFFPFAGVVDQEEIPSDVQIFGIWTNFLGGGYASTKPQLLGASSLKSPYTINGFAYDGESGIYVRPTNRWYGLSVRPVLGAGPQPGPKEETL